MNPRVHHLAVSQIAEKWREDIEDCNSPESPTSNYTEDHQTVKIGKCREDNEDCTRLKVPF